VREQPGDDIEFGFSDEAGARPENRAAARYLKRHAPFAAHFSLHGMAYAEGAWFLLCREWAGRSGPLMDALVSLCRHVGLPLHDIDRKGEKGFVRIRSGFATTPTSTAMRAFFEQRDDPVTAAKFLPSSMEYVAGLGGDPLCAVSEIPLFLITRGETTLSDPVLFRFRDALSSARITENLAELVQVFGLQPVPFAEQIRIQLALLLLGLHHVTGNH
jgi:hypothetical protein